MTTRPTSFSLVVGLALGSLLTYLLCTTTGQVLRAEPAAPAATAAPALTPAKPSEAQRFQISSSGLQVIEHGKGEKTDLYCAAYILDSQTGEVFLVTNGQSPIALGSVIKQK